MKSGEEPPEPLSQTSECEKSPMGDVQRVMMNVMNEIHNSISCYMMQEVLYRQVLLMFRDTLTMPSKRSQVRSLVH